MAFSRQLLTFFPLALPFALFIANAQHTDTSSGVALFGPEASTPSCATGVALNDAMKNSSSDMVHRGSAKACQELCKATAYCSHFTWYSDSGGCWRQSDTVTQFREAHAVSGSFNCEASKSDLANVEVQQLSTGSKPPCSLEGVAYINGDFDGSTSGQRKESAELCQKACKGYKKCTFFTWYSNTQECWLQSSNATSVKSAEAVSGPWSCFVWDSNSNSAMPAKRLFLMPGAGADQVEDGAFTQWVWGLCALGCGSLCAATATGYFQPLVTVSERDHRRSRAVTFPPEVEDQVTYSQGEASENLDIHPLLQQQEQHAYTQPQQQQHMCAHQAVEACDHGAAAAQRVSFQATIPVPIQRIQVLRGTQQPQQSQEPWQQLQLPQIVSGSNFTQPSGMVRMTHHI
eukprot:TRINITY_DN29333_c0_g2_i1.p1 TRINITY_DN29333_c0_g2~~TRINITY_DN29333_c0_g2_i1.p1  ORF type:complete len:402 (+),score=55.57 TRINITY_DN29333_c0_g2_i1:76-1281(+)